MENTIVNSVYGRQFIVKNGMKPITVDGKKQYVDKDTLHGIGSVRVIDTYQATDRNHYVKVELYPEEIKQLHAEVLRIEAMTGTFKENWPF